MTPVASTIVLLLLLVGLADVWLGWVQFSPSMWGIYAVGLFWLAFGVMSASFNPLGWVEGADRRPSTSKMQFLAWTIAALFSYVALYAARYPADVLSDIPRNVLVAMGFSVTTMAGAKGITAAYAASGRINKSTPHQLTASGQRTATGLGALVQDDDGVVDLTKIQMLAWTAIALFAYLADTLRLLRTVGGPTKFADIDASLMVLMGLGQGAYLGKKLVTSDTPRLSRVSKVTLTPAGGAAVTTVTVEGESLGATAGVVTLDGLPIQSQSWTDAQVTFTLPAQHPSGAAWPAPPATRTVQIGVIIAGQQSNTLPLAIP